MSKKNKFKQPNKPANQQNQNAQPAPQPHKPVTPVTIEELSSSKTESDFEKKKQQLLDQVKEELEQIKKDKENIEKEIKNKEEEKEKIIQDIATEEPKLEEIRKERKPLDDEIALQREQLEDIKTKIKEAETKADSVINEAEAESIKILDEAKEKAKNENHEFFQSLKEERDELNKQKKELNEKNIQLLKEKNELEYEKNELDEYKSFNEKLRERYEKASPEKIEKLELNLSDEEKKYNELRRIYDEQTIKYNDAQIILENIKADSGISVKNLLLEYETIKERKEELERIHEKYPDEESIKELECAKEKCETLEKKNEELDRERSRYKEEIIAMQSTQKELENYKRMVDATKTLNEHLLKELESHKTALESRTGDTCPALTKVDSEVDENNFIEKLKRRIQRDKLLNLKEIVSHVKNYAGTRKDKLYYMDDDIRAFLAGMAVSRLLILQGMSGTGKSSLPRIFSEAISGFNHLIPVESSWRDRNELLGYYNDFNKKFNAKTFTVELYRSGKEECRNVPTFIVLDEMNLSRIEYYFSDFLAILETDPKDWMIELVSNDMRTLPMDISQEEKEEMKKNSTISEIWERVEKSHRGELTASINDDEKLKLTDYFKNHSLLTGAKDLIDGKKVRVYENVWFIGTANRDESTFEITDKVYDRAQVISLDKKGVSEGKYNDVSQKMIDSDILLNLFDKAINGFKEKPEVEKRLNELDKLLIDKFNTSFGNRIVQQTIKFTAVFTTAGGELDNALDYQISTKILRKVITSDDMTALENLSEIARKNNYKKTESLIAKRKKDLIGK